MGGALWRRSSYLLESHRNSRRQPVGKPSRRPGSPLRVRLALFDGEGLACRVNKVVEDGVYLSPLLDCTSARN